MSLTAKRRLLANCTAGLLLLFAALTELHARTSQQRTLTLDVAQTTGIDARNPDNTLAEARTIDAVHRSVLLRFPGAHKRVISMVQLGWEILKLEILLDYENHETLPAGYISRPGISMSKWTSDPPRWHVIGWPLRRPERRDRHPYLLGPEELSWKKPRARIDISVLLVNPEFGSNVSSRLRAFEENGILLKKLEEYDQRYRDTSNAFEWAVATGGHGLTFKNPRLVVTLRSESGSRISQSRRPAKPEFTQLTDSESLSGARLLSSDEFANRLRKRARRADDTWASQRIRELIRIGGDTASKWFAALETRDYRRYTSLVGDILSTPPRYWQGWGVHDDLLVWHLYGDLLPDFVRNHYKRFWTSWLMPDLPTDSLLHPQRQDAVDYWKRTGDWRGRASFYRGGYNYGVSTQNFNHTAAMGALLGGDIISSNYALADGRHGLEHFPLRLWGFGDGSAQEMLDHYYFSITLSSQKMLADFGPSPLDRLMGRILVDRSIELLSTAYHPNLRRFVAPSGRTNLQQVLVEQDGIQAALHTLSRRGTLNYLHLPFNSTVQGMRVWGHNTPPGRIGMQAISAPWAAEWVTEIIDAKPFPFAETSIENTRGAFRPPLWRRMYLGRHYGLASQDMKAGAIDVIAQWNYRAADATAMEDLGTLTVRYFVNEADLASTHGGAVHHAGGLLTFQDRNRAIVFAKPIDSKDRLIKLAGSAGISKLGVALALWNFRIDPQWDFYVSGRKVERFPISLMAGDVITIKDGVTYLGIIPIPATDLGRNDEIIIGFGGGGKSESNGAFISPALTITSFNLQREKPVGFEELDWLRINTASYGGFVIELGDANEYRSFEDFSRRMMANELRTEWNQSDKVLHVKYRSGADVLEAGFSTEFTQPEAHYPVKPGEQTKAIVYRRINGAWPYLPAGIERDTTYAQQGTTGRLEKNGAVLVTEKGRKAYLQTEPVSGTFTGYNPLPDPTPWSLSVPGGVSIEARGNVSLLRVSVRPGESMLWIDSARKPEQRGREMATHLLVSGLPKRPTVHRNGKLLDNFESVAGSTNAYLIPLGDE